MISRRFLLRQAPPLGASLLLASACRDQPPSSSGTTTDDSGSGSTPTLPLTLSKEPWVSLLGAGMARLRLETREAQAVAVTIQVDGAPLSPAPAPPTLTQTTLTYSWAAGVEIDGVLPDEPGLHVLQEVLLEGLPPGAVVEWSIDLGGGQVRAGRFRTDPGRGAAFSLGWIADTMYPTSADTLALLAAEAPDVVIHGGDIQYQSNPADTWQGFFDAAAPVTRLAALHLCVGNHEDEGQDEITVMYDRLVGGQGEMGEGGRYFSVRYGGVCFVCLDSETGDLSSPDSAQRRWLEATLAAVDADDSLRFAVICMHRPVYTLSKHWPSDTTVRDAIHALCLQHQVPLVLAGHAHCYEHFEVEGVHYVVDGGGGALLYDPDEDAKVAEATRPGEVALRQRASRTYGISRLDVGADGRITLRRLSPDDGLIDTFTIG